MNNPLVSIIIPAYNVQDYIEEAIDSVLNQTYKNIEIFVIDDKSTDNTIKILKQKYSNNPSIKIIEKDENSGPSNSRNIGIKIAKGKYIALLDSDDYYDKEKIKEQVSFMEKNVDIILSSTYLQSFGLQNNIIKFPKKNSEIKDIQLIGCPIAHAALIVRASFLKENNLFYNEKLLYSEDYDFLTRIIEKGGKLCTIPKPLYFYRITGNQASFIKNERHIIINKKQKNISNKIHLKVFQKLINEENNLYNIKYIDYFLRHQSIKDFNEIPLFIKWAKDIVGYNKNKGEVFTSKFLIETYKNSVLSYFLAKETLSWKTLIEYIKIRKECSNLELKYKIKYIMKCLLFLKH